MLRPSDATRVLDDYAAWLNEAARLRKAMAAGNIEVPFPLNSMWLRSEAATRVLPINEEAQAMVDRVIAENTPLEARGFKRHGRTVMRHKSVARTKEDT